MLRALFATTALSFLAFSATLACGGKPPCNTQTCAGCCDSAGVCQTGSLNNACGARGLLCIDCGAQVCFTGACFVRGGNTGGGTGGGSGGGTGGGLGGGAGGGTGGGSGADAGTAFLRWTFPANTSSSNPSCAEASVANVQVTIGGVTETFNCAVGQQLPGAQTRPLTAGTHDLTAAGLSANGYSLYKATAQVQTFTTSATYNLPFQWDVGGVVIGWSISSGTTAQSCSSANLTDMRINFQDSSGNLVFGTAGDVQSCVAAPITYSFLKPGTYNVLIEAISGSGAIYRSNTVTPPTITVQAGVFPDSSSRVTIPIVQQ